MRNSIAGKLLRVATCCAAIASGCGAGGNGSGGNMRQSMMTSVAVSCSPLSVAIGQTSSCTPVVTGTGSYTGSVTWSVSPSGIGSISNSGVFAATAVGTATVTATSMQESSKSGSSAVVITTAPLLGALATTDSGQELAANGFGEIVIPTRWAAIEPTERGFSSSALSALQSKINAAAGVGLSVSLDIGVQYAPSWIFEVGGGTQFVDQYGDVFTGTRSSGNNVANAVTDAAVRAQLKAYIDYLGANLTGVSAVRVGGEAYNELRYPSGRSGSKPNAYWFYDASSQATLSPDIHGWTPGSGTVAQATAFLEAYNDALDGYAVWLVQTARSAFPATTKLEVLMPGWGERPSEIQPAENDLLVGTPDEINQGLDWSGMLPKLPNTSQIVAYSTWADATTGGASNPDPAAFIHSLLPSNMLAGGESTGNGNTTAQGETLMFTDAWQWNWYVANWYFRGQAQTPAEVDSAFVAAQ